ncbi:MAG TPA: TIM barrel protein [Planctomycetota bacterium]|nr:TIM barrel protein [Planctomycetota bacterium]
MNYFDRRSLLAASAALLTASTSAKAQQTPARRSIAGDLPLKNTRTHFAANLEMWWGSLPFPDRIRAANDVGFTAFEFWPWRGKDLDAITAAMKETGMICTQFTGWGFSPGMNDAKNHDKLEQEIKDSCATAKKLGAKMMCVVAGNDIPGVSQEAMHDTVIVGLKRVAKIAEDNDVTLVLEPMNIRVDHKGHCLYGSPPAIKIVRAVGSTHVKILWDLYHMHISEGDLCGHLREGIQELGYVQLADHPGRNEPGTGEIHYNRVLNELANLNYTGYVGVECNPSVPEADAARALALADIW